MKRLAHQRLFFPSLLALGIALLVALPLANLRAQAPGYPDWNAGRDLILNEKPDGGAQEAANPNATVPQWSYGYRAAIADTALTLYTTAEHHNSDGSGFEGFDGGPRNGSGTLEFAVSVYPATGYPNLAADEIYTSIDTQSPDGNNVIRWTCPADGTYSYRVNWRDIDPNGGDGAAGYLVINGAQKFKGTWPNGNGQGASTAGTVVLKAGDLFDVVLNANSSDSSYDSTGTRIVIIPGGVVPPTPVSLPLTTADSNKLDLGAFGVGASVTLTFVGHGDLVDARYQVQPDGSLYAPATGAYAFANQGAAYPNQDGGDGVNHFPGGGANYDASASLYMFAGKLTTDTTDPATIRAGAVVGTFSASPGRGDWFFIGNGATVQVPMAGAHLYVAVNEDNNTDNHGTYTGTLSATGGTPPPTYQDWDAGRDFANNENYNYESRAQNPNALVPQWSYGYRDAIESAALTLFTPDNHADSVVGQSAEHGFGNNNNNVTVNTGTTPVVFSFCCGDLAPIFPADMTLDANNPAHVTVVRWTAPAAGTYTYQAAWDDLDPHGGNGAGGYVVVNGRKAFGQTWDNGLGNGTSATDVVALQIGDTLDFVLDDRGDGGFDTTRFNATVTPGGTVPPALAAALTVDTGDFTYTIKNQPNTGTVVPGDVVTYSLTVRNTGTAPAANVVVRASFDANNAKFKSAGNGGTAAANVVTWTLPTLAAGGSQTLTYSVKVKGNVDTAAGIRLGATTLSATADAPATPLSTADLPSVGLTVVPLFNVLLEGDGTQVAPGGALTYTFRATNRSAAAVTAAQVYVNLPDGYLPANFGSATLLDAAGNPTGQKIKLGASGANGGFDPTRLLVVLGTINPGSYARFRVVVNVPYEAAPGSAITLPPLALQGVQGSDFLTYNSPSYSENISATLPPAAPPSVGVFKLVPTAANLQTFLAVANDRSLLDDPKNYLAKQAKQLFAALAAYTGKDQATLQALNAEQLAQLLNPFVTVDTDPDSGESLYDVPSPNSKQPAPYVTYMLLYLNTGKGDAAGITISDRVADVFQVDKSSIAVKGAATTNSDPVGADGHSLTFAFGKILHGSGGLILYKAKVPAPAAGGPALGSIIDPITASLITASLSGQSFYTPAERLLITGKANAIVSASESDPGNGTAVYTIYYQNTGGQKSNDLIVVSEVPQGGVYQSAQLLDVGQNHREPNPAKGEHVYPPASPTSGRVVFELGKVKPREFGFVQVTYKLGDAALALKPAGLTHHYGIDQTSFPGATTNAMRADRPTPRVVSRGPSTRFNPGDVGNFFKKGFDNVTHAIGSVFGDGNQPQGVAPTIWIQRVAPLAVQEDTDFAYLVTVGNCGKTPAYNVNLGVQSPSGSTFVSTTGGTYLPPPAGNPADSAVILTVNNLAAGAYQTIKLVYHVTAKAGSSVVSSQINGSGFGTPLVQYNSGDVSVGPTSSLVYSAQQSRNFPSLQTKIAANAAQAGGIDPGALSSGLLFAQRAGAINPESIQTSIAHADYVVLKQGGSLVAAGAGNLVAAGAGNLIAAGAGNLVAAGAGNLVAAGAGNLVAAGAGNVITLTGVSGVGTLSGADLLSSSGNFSRLIAAGAGNLVAAGAGNLISQDGSGFLDYRTGSSLFAVSALPFKTVIAAGLGNARSLGLISQDGTGLISQDGTGLISQDGSGFKAIGGGSALISNDGSGFRNALGGRPIPRTGSVRAGTVLGSPANSISLDFNSNGNMVFGVGGSSRN